MASARDQPDAKQRGAINSPARKQLARVTHPTGGGGRRYFAGRRQMRSQDDGAVNLRSQDF
eukprot:1969102-Pyramimonas_sp.AAC.1